MRKSYSKKQLPFSYRDYLSNGESIPKGTTIQDYKIVKEIGKGAFGKIYLAQNANRESFALKLMDLQKIQKETNPRVKEIRWRLVKNEPILMQQCNSPNVLKCFDIFQNQALKLLVLEYCNGTTLQSHIDRKGKIKEEDAVKILRQIINGIAELHNHNIIHRDLKADNIMEHEGEYKIIDLGFSKKLDIQHEQQEVAGTTLGTVTTMAPEVLQKASYGLKADIWSIGVIFFQMVFGVLLYDTVTVRQRLKEIQTKKYFSSDKELTLNGTTISKEANNFLFRALEVNTEKRMGWRELLDHPLIKQKQEESIGSQFFVSYHLKEPRVNQNALLVEKQEIQPHTPSRQEKEEEEQRASEGVKEQKSIEQLIAQKNQNQVMLLAEKEQRRKQIQTLQQMFPDQKPKETKQKYKIDINYSAKSRAIKTDRQEDIIDNNEESFSRWQQEKYISNQQSPKIQSQIPTNRWQVNPNQVPNFYEHNLKKSFQKPSSHIEDSPDYIWVKQAHLQCLKSRFIYYQLIVPIERDALLDFDDRSAIQFMFLIAARSFNNLSIIKHRIQSDSNEVKAIVKNLYDQVRELYKKVYEKFLLYSDRLTNSQNSMKEMFFDFFKKRFNKKEEDTKSSFTSGIECRDNESIGDYSRAEQIHFTHERYVQAMLISLQKQTNTEQVSGYIRNYKRIMSVSLLELDGEAFEDFVKRVTS